MSYQSCARQPNFPQIRPRWVSKLWNGGARPRGWEEWLHSTYIGPCSLWNYAWQCEGRSSLCRCAIFQWAWWCWCIPCELKFPWRLQRASNMFWYIQDWKIIAICRYLIPHTGPWLFQWYALCTTCSCCRSPQAACGYRCRTVEDVQHRSRWTPLHIPGDVRSLCFQ